MKTENLTIAYAQKRQPWTLPYSSGVESAAESDVPHILGSHAVLHAMKSLGKLAAVFEALDHGDKEISAAQADVVAAMSADLMTIALRFANLYDFDLAGTLVSRVEEKNGVNILAPAEPLRASGGQQEHSEVLRALGQPTEGDGQEHGEILEALRKC